MRWICEVAKRAGDFAKERFDKEHRIDIKNEDI